MKRLILLMTLITALPSAWADNAVQQSNSRAVVWDGNPINVTVAVGQETLLSFDGDVRVGVPPLLYQSAAVDSLSGTIYITADKPFEAQRLQVERLRDGMVMLIDVSARAGIMAQTQVDILTLDEKKALEEDVAINNAFEQHVQRLSMPVPTLLVRYAYQNLYSPSHAIEPLPGVVRSTMQIEKDIQPQAFSLWPVTATPVAAWSLDGYTVTAVTLTHQNNDSLFLDPRQVTADLYGLSFAFPDLGPLGTDSSTSTAFMVSKGPLADSLPPKPVIAVEGDSHDQ